MHQHLVVGSGPVEGAEKPQVLVAFLGGREVEQPQPVVEGERVDTERGTLSRRVTGDRSGHRFWSSRSLGDLWWNGGPTRWSVCRIAVADAMRHAAARLAFRSTLRKAVQRFQYGQRAAAAQVLVVALVARGAQAAIAGG